MLDHTHYLDYVVTEVFYSRQDIVLEISERMNFFFNARHADVAFVHLHISVLPFRFRVFPLIIV
jgi:hypothetical protein